MKEIRVIARAVIQNSDGKILLLKRSKTDEIRPHEWDLPGGYVEENEDFKLGVARETKEEAGITIELDDFHLFHANSGESPSGLRCWLYFLAQTDSDKVTLSYEHEDYHWFGLDEAIKVHEDEHQREVLLYVKNNNLFA